MSFESDHEREYEDAELSLEALRAAWHDVVPPEPSDDLADADPLTQRCVTYLRTAWDAQPAPAASARDFRQRLRFRRRRSLARRLVAVAAVLFVVGSLGAVFVLVRARPAVEHDGPDQVADAGLSAQPDAQPDGPPDGAPGTLPEAPRIAAVTADHVELVSGPVRLVLLTPGGGAPRTPATRTPSTDGGTPR